MTTTIKNALEVMKHFSPYNGNEYGDEDTYIEIYNALRILACVGIISQEDWKKVYIHDEKLAGTTPEQIMECLTLEVMGG